MGAAQRKAVARPSAEQPGAELFGPVLVEPARRKNSMRQAVTEARRELALELPAVVRALAEQAKTGSVTHLKLFLELSGVLKGGLTVPEKKVRERTLEEILVQQWEEDKAMDSAERAERAERDRERAEEVLSGI